MNLLSLLGKLGASPIARCRYADRLRRQPSPKREIENPEEIATARTVAFMTVGHFAS